MTRLFAEAQARGGNALIAMRFDTTELGANWTEICAYGTAVVAIPVTEAAKQTAIQLGYGQPAAARPAPAQQPSGQWDQPTGYQPTAQPTGYQPTSSEWDRPAGGQPPQR
jgi:putative heavy-metal-binding protein